jgi:pilus assembly protein CpaE
MGDELVSAVRRGGEMARLERSKDKQGRGAVATAGGRIVAPAAGGLLDGKIITVYSPKGGTGCTTLAVNLAIALHNEDTRVVLVDAKLQYGDVAMFFNEQGKNTILDIAPRVDDLDPETVEEIMIKHEASGIHIVAAPQRPEHADKISTAQFTKVLEYLRQLYAYVVVDTSSTLTSGGISEAAVDISDVVVLVTTQDIPAIKNARLFLELLQGAGVDRERIVFVMNKYTTKITITPERVGDNLKQKVAAVVPLAEAVVVNAVNHGVPFMLDNRTQPVAKGIYALAEAVRAQVAALEVQSALPSRR